MLLNVLNTGYIDIVLKYIRCLEYRELRVPTVPSPPCPDCFVFWKWEMVRFKTEFRHLVPRNRMRYYTGFRFRFIEIYSRENSHCI